MKSKTTPGCCNNAIGTESLPASQDCQSPAIPVRACGDLTVKGNTGIADWVLKQVADDLTSHTLRFALSLMVSHSFCPYNLDSAHVDGM
jgi:hypothetical protein